jgi:hypothetical protein
MVLAYRGSVLGVAYHPRDGTETILHAVVRDHLEALRTAVTRGGHELPSFVEREFRAFLGCGVLARGFARVRCGACAFERLVPFSCKGRGFCPSCGGRRMTAQAAHLVDAVLPRVGVRQWVLSVPYRLRYLLAFDHRLCRSVLRVYVRALLAFQRRCARRAGVRDGQGGAVTVIQRFGGGVNLHVHFHTMVLEGVFCAADDETTLRFLPLPAASDAQVARVLRTIHARVCRLLRRRGLDPADHTDGAPDPLAEESPVLAGLASAAVQGRVALGPRAGTRVLRLGRDPDAPWVTSRGQRQAALGGFDLHADVAVPAGDRARLESLCRYVLRPPLAQERLRLTGEGQVLVTLKSRWHDGTTRLLFEPVEFLAKLAALVPRPRVNLIIYSGVLAPHHRWRAQVVGYGKPDDVDAGDSSAGGDGDTTRQCRRHWRWAELMRRAFEVDVLECPRCGGRMELIATIDDPAVVRKILRHLGLPTDGPEARPPPEAQRSFH